MNTRRRRIARHRRRLTSLSCPVHIPPWDRIWRLELYIVRKYPRRNFYDWLMKQTPLPPSSPMQSIENYLSAGSLTHCKINRLSNYELSQLFGRIARNPKPDLL